MGLRVDSGNRMQLGEMGWRSRSSSDTFQPCDLGQVSLASQSQCVLPVCVKLGLSTAGAGGGGQWGLPLLV